MFPISRPTYVVHLRQIGLAPMNWPMSLRELSSGYGSVGRSLFHHLPLISPTFYFKVWGGEDKYCTPGHIYSGPSLWMGGWNGNALSARAHKVEVFNFYQSLRELDSRCLAYSDSSCIWYLRLHCKLPALCEF
ncbi:hypothetical protein NPIL_317831 [Nephila pilipes]|uniref:Uncharacterized protein n=1 Tax=Nephila pilipes TaxID=299642 RepID=A0A8X6QRI3_NEPPI|nr:hypothetical protein NPIL_317831 [Nephila pilipes]